MRNSLSCLAGKGSTGEIVACQIPEDSPPGGQVRLLLFVRIHFLIY